MSAGAELRIEGPDTITLTPGVPLAILTTAVSTSGRIVSSARVRLDILAPVAVQGDTLTAGTEDTGYVLEATWLRSDGQRPTARKPVVVKNKVEIPPPPVEEEPPPTGAVLKANFDVQVNGLSVIVDRRPSIRPQENGLVTEWTFGDEGTGSEAVATHTFSAAGDYPITLRLTHRNYQGLESTITKTVTVTGASVPVPPDEEEEEPDPHVPLPDPDPGIPPVIPPPSGNLPALPVVRSLRLDQKHTDRRANGWDDVDVKSSAARYVTDPLGERGTVLEASYTTGITPGTSPIQKVQTLGALGLSEAIFACGIMVDDTFFGNWAEENKQFWLGINSEGNNVFFTLRGVGKVPQFQAGVKIQGIVDPRRESMSDGFVKGGTIARKRWYDIAVYARMNTYLTPHRQVAGFGWQGDKADGVLALEIDGKLVGQLNDINFTQASDSGLRILPKINSAMLHPTWGGGGAPNPQLGHSYYDRLLVYGR